ncbi:MAG: GspE/PulE family protein [Verrucomicrobiota bacterium]|nr:GspE/PulE family protein [Verrucomicrobiota bacterium]
MRRTYTQRLRFTPCLNWIRAIVVVFCLLAGILDGLAQTTSERPSPQDVPLQTQISVPLTNGEIIDGVKISQGPAGMRLRDASGNLRDIRWDAINLAQWSAVPSSETDQGSGIKLPDVKLQDLIRPEDVERIKNQRHNTLAFIIFSGIVLSIFFALLSWVDQDLADRPMPRSSWNALMLFTLGLAVVPYLVLRKAKRMDVQKQRPTAPRRKRGFLAKLLSSGKLGGGGGEKLVPVGAFRPVDRAFVRRIQLLDDRGNSVRREGSKGHKTGLDNARTLIAQGIFEQASDLHLEMKEEGLFTRVRLDGVLYDRMEYDIEEGRRTLAALKTMAGIDVAEKKKAQDGHFQVLCEGRPVDFRVASTSAIHGEKIVLRILDKSKPIQSLTDLGMGPNQQHEFKQAIKQTAGMVLMVGPTGAGKTSTIYAALQLIDTSKRNLMTIEDPVEYELPNATQLQVNERAGITFESGLQSILRQDPDVILVGEIRNPETAETAVRASLTGHLVFSTLHANNAENGVIRLKEMGINSFHLSSSLVCIVGQRLIRKLCPHCKEGQTPKDKEEILYLDPRPGQGLPKLFRAAGCPICSDTGYIGRTGVFQVVNINDRIKQALSEEMTEVILRRYTRQGAVGGLKADALRKAREGITSLQEVMRVIGDD